MNDIDQIQKSLANNGFYLLDLIGSGAFSDVYLCQNSKYNHFFAIKKVLKKKLAQHEIDALIALIHPYIVKLYQTFSDENYQYLVMEYCPNGTIKQMGKLTYEKFIFYAKQLLEVLNYCHSQKIAHRDIKPENIFIDQYNHVKLGDFGLADKFHENGSSQEKCGSLLFCSPEIITSSQFDPFKADIWALGITFYNMITGHLPYPDCSNDTLRNLIAFSQIDFTNDNVDPQIQYLIMKMTSKNPMFRPTASQLLKFPLFKAPSLIGKKIINSSYSTNFGHRKSCTHLSFQDGKLASSYHQESTVENPKPEKETEIPIKLSKIRSFRSLNFNIPQHTCQHFVKYD